MLDDNILHYSLKTYEGDIYDNHLILVISGAFSSYLAYSLMQTFRPALALTMAFIIMGISGFIYP
jgi:hypothetical protein